MNRLTALLIGFIACILFFSVSSYADTGNIEISGEDVSRPVEIAMTVSFTVEPEYKIVIPAEKRDPVSDAVITPGYYRVAVSEEAQGIITAYPETAIPGTIVFLRTDFPEDSVDIVYVNGDPAEVTESDRNIFWFYMPETDVVLNIQTG